MPDTIDAIQRRLELAGYLPEQFGIGNSAADRWREDVTTLLAEVEFWKQRAMIEGEAVMQASEEAERLRAELRTCQEVLTACLDVE